MRRNNGHSEEDANEASSCPCRGPSNVVMMMRIRGGGLRFLRVLQGFCFSYASTGKNDCLKGLLKSKNRHLFQCNTNGGNR